MTTAQLSHLRAIDAHLERLLGIAAKRTPGEWKIEPGNENELWGDSDYICDCFDNRQSNAAFIASCAGNAEAGWIATRAAIAAILGCRSCGGTGVTDGWLPTYADPDNASLAKEAEPCCEHAKEILAAFPLELIEA